MDLAWTPFLQFTEIYITSFQSGGFTSATAMNQKDKNFGKLEIYRQKTQFKLGKKNVQIDT